MDQVYTISKDSAELDCQLNLKNDNESTPLKPTVLDSNDNSWDKSNEKSRNNKLLTRLACAIKKLKCYDQNTDATWSLDTTLLNIKEDTLATDAKLPHHVEENMKAIIHSAQEYIINLDNQLSALNDADQQIENSMIKALNEIDEVYQTLMDEICQEINERREVLRLEAQIYKNEGLIPLKACRQEVNAQIHSTKRLITLAESMLKYPHSFNRDRFGKITAASSNIGRIPEVPYSEELPYINFYRPLDASKEEVLERISKLGYVSRTGPVQILNIEERPACLFVNWYIADPEYAGEEHMFVVQKATGEIHDPSSNVFETVYEGSETSCFVRDLNVGQLVTLRVRIQAHDIPWSVHRTAKTMLQPYRWEIGNDNYVITNNGRFAAKITNDTSTLFSQSSQFDANYVIEFKFLETSREVNDNEGIALVHCPEGHTDSLKRHGALLITTEGKIFMDGEEKLMQLPKIRFGTSIVITGMRKDSDTLRISIECADKGVTYDWHVQTPLYFAARFTEYNKWNFMVK